MTQEKMVWETTVEQLAGSISRLRVMVGAYHCTHEDNGQTFNFRFKLCRKVNYCKVAYEKGTDSYRVEFWKLGKVNFDKVWEYEGVGASQLRELFTAKTGLDLSL